MFDIIIVYVKHLTKEYEHHKLKSAVILFFERCFHYFPLRMVVDKNAVIFMQCSRICVAL